MSNRQTLEYEVLSLETTQMTGYGTVCNKIERLIADKLSVDVPSRETDLVETGILDSLAFVDLLLELEKGFDLEIPIDKIEIDYFRSVQTMAEFLLRQGAVKAVT